MQWHTNTRYSIQSSFNGYNLALSMAIIKQLTRSFRPHGFSYLIDQLFILICVGHKNATYCNSIYIVVNTRISALRDGRGNVVRYRFIGLLNFGISKGIQLHAFSTVQLDHSSNWGSRCVKVSIQLAISKTFRTLIVTQLSLVNVVTVHIMISYDQLNSDLSTRSSLCNTYPFTLEGTQARQSLTLWQYQMQVLRV